MILLENEDEFDDGLMMNLDEMVAVGEERWWKNLYFCYSMEREEEEKRNWLSSPTLIYIWVIIPYNASMVTLVSSLYS